MSPSTTASLAGYRETQSWFDDGSDTEEDAGKEQDDDGDRNMDAMEPRPETQLSVKTTKSAADSAIDLSDDQPHEPKRPSITTFDYREDKAVSEHATDRPPSADKEAIQEPVVQLPSKVSVIYKPGRSMMVPIRTPTLCVFCDEPFPGDEAALMEHLRQHLDDLRGKRPHQCEACNVGFVTKADLDKHLWSAGNLAHCGFRFDHLQPCTGHHPSPKGHPDPAFTDHDSFRLCEQLRHWEIWQ